MLGTRRAPHRAERSARPDVRRGRAGHTNDVRSRRSTTRSRCSRWSGRTATIYVGMGWQFCAINPSGSSRHRIIPAPPGPPSWPTELAILVSAHNADVSASAALAVDKDDYVYFGDRDNSVYKFRGSDGAHVDVQPRPRGSTVHARRPSPPEGTPGCTCRPDSDGTIYFAFSQTGRHRHDPGPQEHRRRTPTTSSGNSGSGSTPHVVAGRHHRPLRRARRVIILGFADAKVRAIKDNGAHRGIRSTGKRRSGPAPSLRPRSSDADG